MMAERGWSIIVHGGARTIRADRHQANRDGCRVAAELGAAILRDGGSAVDGAERAVRALEDDPTFNAGSGSVTTAAGGVEMDAAMMDGRDLRIGAVGAISNIRHPVSVARELLDEETIFLVGQGAEAFAASRGFEQDDIEPTIHSDPQHDTVGCIAVDLQGNVAVATSTGGLPGQLRGRIGDSPIAGCGFYADNRAGGVAISGDGERIIRVTLASRVMMHLEQGTAQEAAEAGMTALQRVGGEAGLIVVDRDGRFGVAHNSDHFAVALASSERPGVVTGITVEELTEGGME